MFTHIIRRYEGENCSKWEEGHPTIIFGILLTFFFTPALEHSKLHFSVWTKAVICISNGQSHEIEVWSQRGKNGII